METVLFTLQPRFASSAGAGSTAAKSSDTIVENLENRFATLAVEEPSEPKTGPAPKTEMQSTSFEHLRKISSKKRISSLYSVSSTILIVCDHMF
ncbi:hypothetical protein WAI453_005525 [Rhynchosporium graminicola]